MLLELYGIKAAIFDMDGVITKTAAVHQRAWKRMFDEFLRQRSNDIQPFSDEDYKNYVDGIPRYKGVESFLQSREIDIPYGEPDDSDSKETICGLGNRKNKYFKELVDSGGVQVFEDTVLQIKNWRQRGVKTAVVSSSKNCRLVMEKAGLLDLFDARVDGEVSLEKQLKGKPDPDIFLEAARMLGVAPGSAAVFEDAISGVKAGKKGKFASIIGVSRSNKKCTLLEHGADVVLKDMRELQLFPQENAKLKFSQKLPSALGEGCHKLVRDKKPFVFLDYDGTLTEIVKQPEKAVLSDEMKKQLHELAEICNVAVITGRDMDDVKARVGMDELIYAGSHGFRISGPNGLYKEHEKTNEILPGLDQIEKEFGEELSDKIEGVQVERKRYAIAIHYRNVADEHVDSLMKITDKVLGRHKNFKKGEGKKIVEIKPDMNWHKGKAVLWILKTLGAADEKNVVPVYIGDDITDEDGFRELADVGIGILVGSHSQPSSASYGLKNIDEVSSFLKLLVECQETVS